MLDQFTRHLYARASNPLVDTLSAFPTSILQKLAFGGMGCGEDHSWLEQFKGTELFDQALELMQEGIQQETEELQTRETMNQFNSSSDQLRLKKKLLELELARQEMAPPEPPPMMPPEVPTAAPAATPGMGAPSTPEAAPDTKMAEAQLRMVLESIDKEAGWLDKARAFIAGKAKDIPMHGAGELMHQSNPLGGVASSIKDSLQPRPSLTNMLGIPTKGVGQMAQESNPLAGVAGSIRDSMKHRPGLETMLGNQTQSMPAFQAPARQPQFNLNSVPVPGARPKTMNMGPPQPELLSAVAPPVRRPAPTLMMNAAEHQAASSRRGVAPTMMDTRSPFAGKTVLSAPIALLRMMKQAGVGEKTAAGVASAALNFAKKNPGTVGGGVLGMGVGAVQGAQTKIDPTTGQATGGGVTGALGGAVAGGTAGTIGGTLLQGAARTGLGAHKVMENHAAKGLVAPGGYGGQLLDQGMRRASMFGGDVRRLGNAAGKGIESLQGSIGKEVAVRRGVRGPATPLPNTGLPAATEGAV